VAELAKPNATILLERSGTRLVEHALPAAPNIVDYPNELAALTIFRKRITELVRAGWQLSRADSDIGSPIASDARMEAQLRASFDPEQLSVYNDWLIEHGDPCGDHGAIRGSEADHAALVAERGYEIFGSFHDLVTAMPKHRPTIELLWKHGWVTGFLLSRVRLGTLLGFAMQAPIARFASHLSVDGDCHGATLRYAVQRSPHKAAIRSLHVLDAYVGQQLLEVLPSLEAVELPHDSSSTGHPLVRTLTIQAARGRDSPLIQGAWPAVEHVAIRGRRINGEILADAIEATQFHRLPRLHHVDVDVEPDLDRESLGRIRTRLKSFTT
jgi:hypothetical protein